jgi:hypothetical protein
MSKRCELTINSVSAATRLITEIERSMARESFRHLCDLIGCVRNDSNKANRAIPAIFSNADGNRVSMNVQSNK